MTIRACLLAVVAAGCIASFTPAQLYGFEPCPAGPMPGLPAPGCPLEGWGSAGGTVTIAPSGAIPGPLCTFPTEGSQWCIVNARGAGGGLAALPGGPAPLPVAAGATGNVQIPMIMPVPAPPCLLAIAFDWTFVTPECASAARNDWVSVDLYLGGVPIWNLLYRDTFSPSLAAGAGLSPDETGGVPAGTCPPAGAREERRRCTFKTSVTEIPAVLYGAPVTFQVNVGNGGDATGHSYFWIDNVRVTVEPRRRVIFRQNTTSVQSPVGGDLTVSTLGLDVGLETYTFISPVLAPNGPGSGALLGLDAGALPTLLAQATMPLGTPMFHFTALTHNVQWPPFQNVPGGVSLEATCLQIDPWSNPPYHVGEVTSFAIQ